MTRYRIPSTDPRLGRHVNHDPRSLRYLAPAQPVSTLTSVRHSSSIPILDQGDLGSCTGNAATACLSYESFWGTGSTVLSTTDATADETYAVGVYSDATKIDDYDGTYPPTDTGSDGLSVAKVLTNRGLISGYTHATSLEAALTALQTQAVITGTEWLNGMFTPDADGRLHVTGSVAGGHEYVLDEVDVPNQRVWMRNSWGDSWGVQGRAYFTWADFQKLLAKDGDVTVFTPASQPAPTPTPDPSDVDSVLVPIVQRLLKLKALPKWARTALEAWLDAQS